MAGALPAVLAYRFFNFVLATFPAFWTRSKIEPLVVGETDEAAALAELASA